MGSSLEKLHDRAEKHGANQPHRHIFLCSESSCSHGNEGEAAWKYLRKRLKQLDLPDGQVGACCTRADCFHICTRGPIAVVYPEGVWYHSCTPEVLEQIIDQHLLKGIIVEAYAFARNPLCAENCDLCAD